MMQTSFRCFRSLPFFIFPKFTSLKFHLVVKHVHCFCVVFLSFGVDMIPSVSFSGWKKPFCFATFLESAILVHTLQTLIPPKFPRKFPTSYTCRPGWLSGEQGDSDWAKRHLLNAKLMDRAMKADWKRMAGKADFHAHLLRWMEMTKSTTCFTFLGQKWLTKE